MEEGGEDNNNNHRPKKQSKGRKKIELKRLEKKEDRTSTFSKRKFGIHKKATEISTLCGVEVGFFAVSPSGNPCTYATSSIDDLSDRLLLRRGGGDNIPAMECDELEKILLEEQEISSRLENFVGDVSVEDLSVEELLEVKRFAEESHRKISDHLVRRDRLRSGSGAGTSSSGFPRR